MRVDAVNQISQIYKPSGAKKVERSGTVNNKDAYEISQFARDYQTAKNAVSEASEVREEKVSRIKEALASGNYNVSAQEIAEKIVSNYFDCSI